MSSTNNSNTPAKTSNHDDPISSISPVLGTSKPSPLSTPSVANRRYLEAVNENKTERKKRSFDETGTIVEEQESHGAMTLQSNVKRAKKGPSLGDMIEFIEEHEPHADASEMELGDLQQAYDRIVNKQQCTEERKNDPVQIHTHSTSSNESHVHVFYQIALVKRNNQSAEHAECKLAVDKFLEDVSNTKQDLAALKRVEAMFAGDLDRDSKDEKNEIKEMEENLREDMQNKREFWDQHVNEQLEKFQRPLLTEIDMKKAELAKKTSTQHQKLADVRNSMKECEKKLLQEERALEWAGE